MPDRPFPEATTPDDDFLPLVRTLLRGFRAVDGVAARALASAGFDGSGPASWYLLHSIPADGGRASSMARTLGVSKQAVGQTLEELESCGYIRRERDPDDGRALIVLLTEEGQRVVRAGEDALLAQEEAWAHALGRTRIRALRETMEEFATLLEEER